MWRVACSYGRLLPKTTPNSVANACRALSTMSTGSSQQVIKRFYKKVDVVSTTDKATGAQQFAVQLDARPLKTPEKKPLLLQNETLANLVALEWDNQPAVIMRHDMHLTSLCCTAIDKGGKDREARTERLVQHVNTDAVCYHHDLPQELTDFQKEHWIPIIDWFTNKYSVPLDCTLSIAPVQQSPETLEAVNSQLQGMNNWGFEGFEFAVECSKSPVLTMALFDGRINAQEATFLSLLESEFQIKRWGEVEWSHTLNRASTETRLAAAALFYRLSKDQ